MSEFTLKVNKKEFKVDVNPQTPILWVLRDQLKLVGTKFGCGIGQCGACTIHFNGSAIRSCLLPVVAAANIEITTIEGLSDDGSHPVQKAWVEHDVSQCGYCQAGQIMTAASLLATNSKPTEEEISSTMAGNICRCGTYSKINEAVKKASENV